jgi:hypothetical protein
MITTPRKCAARLPWALCLCAFVPLCLPSAAAAEAPPKFTAKPAAAKSADGKTKIDFAVDRETDVAVFVENGGGKVVRHLVAGVLGQKAPPPLKPGLAQSVEWDGKADYGKDAGSGPFKVRVALGLGAKYDKVLVSDPYTLGGVNALAVAPDGTLCLMMGCGGTGPVWSGQQMVAFNRDGTYQRMLMPFASDLKGEEVKGFDTVEVDGRPAPLVHAISARSFYAASTPRKAGLAVTPDGKVLTLAGFNIGALDLRGGCPWGSYLGPKLLALVRGRFTGRPFIAASADGKAAYVSGLMDYLPDKKPPEVSFAAVYRVTLPGRGPAEPFFGDPKQAGNDETHLGGASQARPATARATCSSPTTRTAAWWSPPRRTGSSSTPSRWRSRMAWRWTRRPGRCT